VEEHLSDCRLIMFSACYMLMASTFDWPLLCLLHCVWF